MSNDKTEERAAFEAWYEGKLADHMPAAWEAWQARAALSSRPVQGGASDEQLAEAGRIWVYSVGTGNGPDFEGMRAALSSAPAQPVREPMWQPIETAPKEALFTDGENKYCQRILVWASGYDDPRRARWWYRSDSGASNFIADGGFAVFPTHWMPLPAAPGITKE